MAYLSENAKAEEIERYKIGVKRFAILQGVAKDELSVSEACEILGVSLSQFYRIRSRAVGAITYQALVPGRVGRKVGLAKIRSDVEKLIRELFLEHYPTARTYSAVWKACQSEADVRLLPRPSYHIVSSWIKRQDQRLLFEMKFGKDAAKQHFESRPGYKETNSPLEWVQMDHTECDILLVDESDPKIIIGRPWISYAICIHTRVILGFYISFLRPSAVTVAMLLEFCVLPKDEILTRWGLPLHLWPMSGLPIVIHTDNAKEFISDVVALNAEDFDIDAQQRDIPEKHQGGHIESLIGKQMLHTIHQLPGSTGSNVVQRKSRNSEKTARLTLPKLRRALVWNIHSYHQTKHSELGRLPAEAWDEYFIKHPNHRVLAEERRETFKYVFYPEKLQKLVQPEGIELFRRFYFSKDIEDHTRERFDVKYDPYDISYIMVKIRDAWVRVPCVRNNFKRSDDYEIYRWERQQKGQRDGTMSAEGAASARKFHQEINAKLTPSEKRQRKRDEGEKTYKAENKMSQLGNASSGNYNESVTQRSRPSGKHHQASDGAKPKSKPISNVINEEAFFNDKKNVDYDQEPVIYDSSLHSK